MIRSIRNQLVPTKISLLQAILSTISSLSIWPHAYKQDGASHSVHNQLAFHLASSLQSARCKPLCPQSARFPSGLIRTSRTVQATLSTISSLSQNHPCRFLFKIILYDKCKCGAEHHQFDGETVFSRGERDKSRRSR